MDRVDNLLNTPYWIIDILPMRVPIMYSNELTGIV